MLINFWLFFKVNNFFFSFRLKSLFLYSIVFQYVSTEAIKTFHTNDHQITMFIVTNKADEIEKISKVAISLKMLSMRIVKFGWNLLDICYLSSEVFGDGFPFPPATKMFPANVEDSFIRADILVQTFREINGISLQFQENQNRETFLQNVEKVHNVMSKLESLQNTG